MKQVMQSVRALRVTLPEKLGIDNRLIRCWTVIADVRKIPSKPP